MVISSPAILKNEETYVISNGELETPEYQQVQGGSSDTHTLYAALETFHGDPPYNQLGQRPTSDQPPMLPPLRPVMAGETPPRNLLTRAFNNPIIRVGLAAVTLGISELLIALSPKQVTPTKSPPLPTANAISNPMCGPTEHLQGTLSSTGSGNEYKEVDPEPTYMPAGALRTQQPTYEVGPPSPINNNMAELLSVNPVTTVSTTGLITPSRVGTKETSPIQGTLQRSPSVTSSHDSGLGLTADNSPETPRRVMFLPDGTPIEGGFVAKQVNILGGRRTPPPRTMEKGFIAGEAPGASRLTEKEMY